MNLLTKHQEVILASESKTRKKILKTYGINFKTKKHNINEKKYINNDSPQKIVKTLAKRKAESLKFFFPNSIIIGSDQILVFNKKILTKAKTKKEAFQNFLILRGQEYRLLSSIYILNKGKFFWKTTKSAKLYMQFIKKKKITDYINKHEKVISSILGSYKIEKDIMNCIEILKGDIETIQGFPIANFIKKIRE